jgi:hypothetical protein
MMEQHNFALDKSLDRNYLFFVTFDAQLELRGATVKMDGTCEYPAWQYELMDLRYEIPPMAEGMEHLVYVPVRKTEPTPVPYEQLAGKAIDATFELNNVSMSTFQTVLSIEKWLHERHPEMCHFTTCNRNFGVRNSQPSAATAIAFKEDIELLISQAK